MSPIYIYLQNGTYLEGRSFGAEGTAVGEIVFNTSMTGYQEIISDPSYAGQFVTFTTPEIGNVGVNKQDMESIGAYTKGVIVRSYQGRYSNFRAQESLSSFLKKHNIIGISELDTRFLTKLLRDEGSMMMIASTQISDRAKLEAELNSSPPIEEINYINEVSTKTSYVHEYGTYSSSAFEYNKGSKKEANIVALDFGVKRNILNELTEAGLNVSVEPNSTSAQSLIDRFNSGDIDGVFLSNGPGDPLVLNNEVKKIKSLVENRIPLFGICLGHQLLSIAHGYPTYKLKFGHHGGNHPIKNIKTGMVEITAQNHNYNVPETVKEVAEVTHTNLFDGTIEGLIYKDSPTFSVQHHPEASPGPHESRYVFDKFVENIKETRAKRINS